MTNDDASGIPAGWKVQGLKDTFSAHAGPFFFRENAPGVGFVAEPHHLNGHGNIHGGALMTLADMAIFNVFWHAIGAFKAVTLSTTVDFVAAGRVGEFIEATGEATKATGSILFARGRIFSKERTIATFSGSLKRFT